MESKVTYQSIITESLTRTKETIENLNTEKYSKLIRELSEVIINCLKNEGKVLLAGNGGSAADAQHIAGEFVSRFLFDRPGLPAIAITTDTSIMTAIGNDYGYERLFARQLQALGREGDVFIAISTSGNSPNILEAINEAREKGITVIGFTGAKGGKMKTLCDYCFCAPSDMTPHIQEAHITVGHLICCLVEEVIFKGELS